MNESTYGVAQLRPHSRDQVRIRSADPFVAPEIQPNYLADERDRAELLAGMQFTRRLFAAPALARHLQSETFTGPSAASDDALLDHARSTGSTDYHPVGTCHVGSDDRSPLDAQLRVRGVEGLRVIVASAMPTTVSGNTYAGSIMIAEKSADDLLRSRRKTIFCERKPIGR